MLKYFASILNIFFNTAKRLFNTNVGEIHAFGVILFFLVVSNKIIESWVFIIDLL